MHLFIIFRYLNFFKKKKFHLNKVKVKNILSDKTAKEKNVNLIAYLQKWAETKNELKTQLAEINKNED